MLINPLMPNGELFAVVVVPLVAVRVKGQRQMVALVFSIQISEFIGLSEHHEEIRSPLQLMKYFPESSQVVGKYDLLFLSFK